MSKLKLTISKARGNDRGPDAICNHFDERLPAVRMRGVATPEVSIITRLRRAGVCWERRLAISHGKQLRNWLVMSVCEEGVVSSITH